MSVLFYGGRIDRDPRVGGETLTDARVPRAKSEDEVVSALASFVAEATISETSFKSGHEKHPLWEFPEEGRPSAVAAAGNPAIRKRSIYAPLAAAIVVAAAIGGAWWEGLIPRSAPVGTDATAEAVVIAPVVELSAGTSSRPPAQLTPSVEIRPSIWPPMASIAPTVLREDRRVANDPPSSAARADVEPQQYQPRERVIPVPRGTISGGPSVPIPSVGPRPSTEPTPTAPMVATNPPAISPASQPPPVADVSPAAAPPPSGILPPVVRPEPAAVSSVVARTEQSEIQRTLARYRSAYQLLDAEAAQAVWPSVDVRALGRAFDSLTSQQLAFESCEFDIAGEAATAQCRGSATYTQKVGNREPKLESRQWTFQLRKIDQDWTIQSAQTRR